MTVVVDASFLLDVLVSEPELDELAKTLAERGLIAPTFFWHEVASGLCNMTLRGRITLEVRRAALERIQRLLVGVETSPTNVPQLLAVSDRYQLSVYDAAYLELAIRTSSALATRDRTLIAAAPKAGVPLSVQVGAAS